MSKIIIDGKEIDVPAEYTLLQACEAAGAEVPRFCFHERLSIAGNCRMCLVEVKGGPPKPTASCAMAVRDLRPGPKGEPPVVETNSPMARKARQGVMEFLLINHPLDCPICDQGGECDLQDQAMGYGVDTLALSTRTSARSKTNISAPLVKTSMNRCIQCTRCVRFATEVAGVSEIGAIGRGEDMEITTYLEQALTSELQGNIVDLCPVGALTSKPYAFHARSWEMTQDRERRRDGRARLGDPRRRARARGDAHPAAHQRGDQRGVDLRQDPPRRRRPEAQRLDRPLRPRRRQAEAGDLAEAFAAIAAKVKATRPRAASARIAGDLPASRRCSRSKALMDKLGVANVDCRQDGSKLASEIRPRLLSVQFDDRRHRRGRRDHDHRLQPAPRSAGAQRAHPQALAASGDCLIGVIGEQADLTYRYNYLGAGPDSLARVRRSSAGQQARSRCSSSAPAPSRGPTATRCWRSRPRRRCRSASSRTAGTASTCCTPPPRASAASISASCRARAGSTRRRWSRRARSIVLFNLGADEIDIEPGAFVVYIGTHGDSGAHRADVILPGAAYTEKTGTYVNTEGRPQFAERAVFPPGDAREDWAILRALSEALGAKLPFDSLSAAARGARAPRIRISARSTTIAPADAGAFASSPASAARWTRRRSPRRSRTSISPTRSPAPRAPWPNARPWRRAVAARRNRPHEQPTPPPDADDR